jgi:SHAQKYF class myb-like DNA-binding protein
MFNKSQYENELSLLNENLFINEPKKNPKFLITQTQNQKENLQKKKNRQLLSLSINNSNGRWTKEEHNKFIEGIIKYGSDWKKIQKHVSTRTSTQARSHAQKFLLKLRNNEFLKKTNIDLSLSWAKVIQLFKNSFSDDVLYKVLKDSSFNKKKGKKKYLKKIKCDNKLNTLLNVNNNENEKELNFDDDVFFSTSDYSNSFDENKENINNFLFYQMENFPVKNYNNNINNKDYINDFIQNFNKNNLCDTDFYINDSNIYYNNSAILSINSNKNNNLNENGDI